MGDVRDVLRIALVWGLRIALAASLLWCYHIADPRSMILIGTLWVIHEIHANRPEVHVMVEHNHEEHHHGR